MAKRKAADDGRSGGAYDRDLAYVHDVGFGAFARNAAPGIVKLLRASGIRDGMVVDLGCGSGILAAELLRAGYDVAGVDMSAAMLRMARSRAPGAKFLKASLLDYEIPACDAVTAIGEVVCYALDARVSRRPLEAVLRRVHAALRPGGMFVFDVAEPGRGSDSAKERYWLKDDWAMLRKASEDEKRRTLTREITVFRRVGGAYRRTDEVHRLRLYPREEVRSVLEQVGFEVNVLDGYGATPFDGSLAGFAAGKRR
jgi:SAM-dependent methyltransferase